MESSSNHSGDFEKGVEPRNISISEEVPDYLAYGDTWLGRVFRPLRDFEEKLDRKLGVESHGIARKLPEDRDPAYSKWSNQMVMFALWASGTMNLSCFATGFLGWDFQLDLGRTIVCLIFATLIGASVSGWAATMGAPTGLRQISISRYSMGWYPAKLIALLNAIENVGWSSVGCITGGLALQALSNNKIGSELGVVIVSVVGFVCSSFGLKAIFAYEKWAWTVFFVVFMIIFGFTGPYASVAIPAQVSGPSLSAACLTLMGVVYGSSASWATIASDYYVEYNPNISRVKVFTLTTMGIALPTCIGMVSGAVVASGMQAQQNAGNLNWYNAWNEGVGFLIQTMLPYALGKIIVFILVLSGIGMNCISMYSSGLSLQQFARPMSIFPRFIWTLVCFVAIILLGLVGRANLLDYLQNFLSLLGYFTTSFFVIMFTEHYIYRKGSFANYNLEAWNDPRRMPLGWAGGFGFACGIGGSVLGMATSEYVGPIANMIAPGGGDIGNELSFLFTLVTFIPARYLELKFVGR